MAHADPHRPVGTAADPAASTTSDGTGHGRLERLGVLRVPEFRWYFAGQTTSLFGNGLSSVALAFAVLSLTRSASLLAVVLLASRLPVIAFILLGGALGDRYSRRRIMAITDTARTVLQAVTATLLLTGHATVWSLAVLQAGAGIASALFSPAASGLVANLAPPGQLRAATSLLGLSASVAQVLAVATSGALVVTVGPGAAFALDAATFAVSTMSLLALHAPALTRPAQPRPGLLHDIADGWHTVRSRAWLLTYCAHVALLNTLAISPFVVLGPHVAKRRLGGATAWAVLLMGYAVGGLAGNTLVVRWQPRHPLRTAIAASLGLAPFLALLALPAPLWLTAPAAVLAGGQATAYNALASTTTQEHLPDHVRARAAAFVTIGGLAAVPIGMGLAGTAASAVGASAVFAAGAAWVVISAITALAVPSLRHLEVTPIANGAAT